MLNSFDSTYYLYSTSPTHGQRLAQSFRKSINADKKAEEDLEVEIPEVLKLPVLPLSPSNKLNSSSSPLMSTNNNNNNSEDSSSSSNLPPPSSHHQQQQQRRENLQKNVTFELEASINGVKILPEQEDR